MERISWPSTANECVSFCVAEAEAAFGYVLLKHKDLEIGGLRNALNDCRPRRGVWRGRPNQRATALHASQGPLTYVALRTKGNPPAATHGLCEWRPQRQLILSSRVVDGLILPRVRSDPDDLRHDPRQPTPTAAR